MGAGPPTTKFDLTLRGDLHAPRAARMALDDLVHDLDGRLLADLRLIITELVTTLLRSGTGAPLCVRVEVISPLSLRGEVEEEGQGTGVPAPAAGQAGPILDGITSRWGVGPHPRRLWFEIDAD